MELLLVVGVEGTGHHMLRAVLQDFLSKPTVVDKGDYYPLLEQRWETTEERLPLNAVKKELQRIVRAYRACNVTHIFEDTSFPFNKPRNALRRPDVLDLCELLQGLMGIKILVLYRNPVSTVYSGLRRGFSTNINLEAKIAESNHIYIERQMSQLPREIYKTIHFEKFVETPVMYLEALSRWWQLGREQISAGHERICRHTSINDIPPKTKSYLQAYFTEVRLRQWISFYQGNPLVKEETL